MSDKNNLTGKLAAITVIAENGAGAENDTELMLRLFPVVRALTAQWNESIRQKQARIAELETMPKELTKTRGNYTFAAIALQMLTLTCVFLKDFLK